MIQKDMDVLKPLKAKPDLHPTRTKSKPNQSKFYSSKLNWIKPIWFKQSSELLWANLSWAEPVICFFQKNSFDISTLVENHYIFLVSLSVCFFPYSLTGIRLELSCLKFGMYLFLKMCWGIPGIFVHRFKENPESLVCLSA